MQALALKSSVDFLCCLSERLDGKEQIKKLKELLWCEDLIKLKLYCVNAKARVQIILIVFQFYYNLSGAHVSDSESYVVHIYFFFFCGDFITILIQEVSKVKSVDCI